MEIIINFTSPLFISIVSSVLLLSGGFVYFFFIKKKPSNYVNVQYLESRIIQCYDYWDKKLIIYDFKNMQRQHPQNEFKMSEFRLAYKNVNDKKKFEKKMANNNNPVIDHPNNPSG